MVIKLEDIKVDAFRFQYKGINVKVKIKVIEVEKMLVFTIGLSNPNNKYDYENWFTKYATINEKEEVHMEYKIIEHPPFKFYSKWLLNDNKLDHFFNTLFDVLQKTNITDQEVKVQKVKAGSKEKQLQLYPETFVSKNLSKKQEEVIRARFIPNEADKIIQKCRRDNLTVRFTDDISKCKRLKLDD